MDKDNKIQSIKRSGWASMMIFSLMLAAIFVICIGYLNYTHYDKQLENEAELLQISAIQAASGLDMQFEKLESVSVTLLSNNEYTSFDAADETADEYERSQRLTELSSIVTGLSHVDNYCDFALIYRNDNAAGKLSDGTKELLGGADGNIYPALKELLNGEKRCWVTGINGSFSKIFYISQANEYTLFLGGFYTDELRYTLTPADKAETPGLVLIDDNGQAIMSLNEPIEETLYREIHGDSFAVIKNTYVYAGKSLKNGWRVVMMKDMTETAELYKRLLLETTIVIVLSMILLMLIYAVIFKDETAYSGSSLASPEVDLLTGIANAEEAENIMADRLETCVSGSTFMLGLVRITNLAELEKKYGRSGYNGAIIKTYRSLVDHYDTYDIDSANIIGRIGEGEFLVLADYTQYDMFQANENLRKGLVQLSEALNSTFIAEAGDVHICVGAAVYPHNSTDYDALFDMAEAALNRAIGDDEKSYALYKKEKGAKK